MLQDVQQNSEPSSSIRQTEESFIRGLTPAEAQSGSGFSTPPMTSVPRIRVMRIPMPTSATSASLPSLMQETREVTSMHASANHSSQHPSVLFRQLAGSVGGSPMQAKHNAFDSACAQTSSSSPNFLSPSLMQQTSSLSTPPNLYQHSSSQQYIETSLSASASKLVEPQVSLAAPPRSTDTSFKEKISTEPPIVSPSTDSTHPKVICCIPEKDLIRFPHEQFEHFLQTNLHSQLSATAIGKTTGPKDHDDSIKAWIADLRARHACANHLSISEYFARGKKNLANLKNVCEAADLHNHATQFLIKERERWLDTRRKAFSRERIRDNSERLVNLWNEALIQGDDKRADELAVSMKYESKVMHDSILMHARHRSTAPQSFFEVSLKSMLRILKIIYLVIVVI